MARYFEQRAISLGIQLHDLVYLPPTPHIQRFFIAHVVAVISQPQIVHLATENTALLIKADNDTPSRFDPFTEFILCRQRSLIVVDKSIRQQQRQASHFRFCANDDIGPIDRQQMQPEIKTRFKIAGFGFER